MKKLPWFEIILAIVVMSISLYAAFSDAQNFSLRWFTRDDAYYYFKVAQNISEGHGSTFDGINRTNGYHPLWMLICIPIFALARFDVILPLRILLLVMSGLSAATAILLYRLLGKIFAPVIGALAAIYWVFSFSVIVNVYQQGLESGIAAFFVALFLLRLYEFELSWRNQEVTQRQLAILGFVGALAIFSRLDLVFLAGMAGIWIVFRGSLLRLFLPLEVIIAAGSILLSYIIRLDLPEYYQFSDIAVLTAGMALIIKLASAFMLGLYDRGIICNVRSLLVRLVSFSILSSVLLGGIMILLSRVGEFAGFPRMVLAWDFAFTLLGFGLTHAAYLHMHGRVEEPETMIPFAGLLSHLRSWFKDALIYFGASFGLLVMYVAWNKIAFGTFSPVSGQIKRWWGSFPARVYGGATRNPLDFFGLAFEGDGAGWTPITNMLGNWINHTTNMSAMVEARYVMALAAVALAAYIILSLNIRLARRSITQAGLIPLVSGAVLQAMYYHAQGYSAFKEWYWVSQRIAAIMLICLLLGMLFSLTRKLPYRQIAAWSIAIYFGYNMALSYWTGMQNIMRYNRWPPGTPYMEIATLLEENTEPGSLIGFTGGGNVGYFIEGRTIVNMDGLINSREYFDALRAGRAGEYLYSIGLDYVLANPAILDHLPYDGQFDPYLEPTDVFYGGKQLLKYRAPGESFIPDPDPTGN